MKKNLAIYLVLLASVFSAVSCGSEVEEAEPLPYAMIKSFRLGEIRSSYPAFTSDGRDTVLRKTISMATVPFSIDQAAGKIFNADSLLFGTDVSKVTITMSAEGIPSIYVDSTGLYENIYTTDSLDFTAPRKFRVYSAGALCYKDYEISVNVHQVDPELMVWQKSQAPEGILPVRAAGLGDEMCLFGTDAAGNVAVSKTALNDTVWSASGVAGLPAEALASVTAYNGRLYAVASGNVYSSANAIDWEVTPTGTGAVAIVGASDEEQKLWIAGDGGLLCSSDGLSFEAAGNLPEGFPLYGVSQASYPLAHNRNIIRYMLVGYPTAAKEGNPSVWCRLSNESKWACYDDEHNQFPCPALKDVTVLHYDNFLYALGGAGKAGGVERAAFSSFFVSKDNGIVWRENESFYQRLPKELAGSSLPFAIASDSRNFIWIIAGGPDGGVWKGIINRLGFKE